jgi:hypothetical protein
VQSNSSGIADAAKRFRAYKSGRSIVAKRWGYTCCTSAPRRSVRKTDSWPEDPDEKRADEDAHDQREGAEWNSALANDVISAIPGDDERHE